MNETQTQPLPMGEFAIPLERDVFLRTLLRHLAGTLQKVVGRPALCVLTSNVLGAIAAANLDYAKVAIEQAIARGAAGCRVVVNPELTPEAMAAQGREYYKG